MWNLSRRNNFQNYGNRSSLPEKGLIFDIPKNKEKFKCPLCNKIFYQKIENREIVAWLMILKQKKINDIK